MVPCACPTLSVPKRHLDWFTGFAGLKAVTATHTQTDRPRYSVCSNSPHLALRAAMRAENAQIRRAEEPRSRTDRASYPRDAVGLSVGLSVTSRCSIETNGRIEFVFDVEATFEPFSTVL